MPGVVKSGIGEMRSVVQMLKNVPTIAGAGYEDHYGIIVTTRGRLRKSGGNRTLSFSEIVNAETYELIMRYQVAIDNDLRIDTKFLINGLVYTIDTWETFEQINFYYRIIVKINRDGAITVIAPTPIGSDAGVQARWLTTTPGGNTVTSADTLNKTILGVARSGVEFTLVSGTPGNLEVSYSGSTLIFDPLTPFNSGEIVYVLYKIGS